jgi:hypothetical protein
MEGVAIILVIDIDNKEGVLKKNRIRTENKQEIV